VRKELSAADAARDREDAELLESGGYGRLLATYYEEVRGRCRAAIRNEADADEVTQRVFERVLRELKAGKTYPIRFRAALHNIVTWTIKDFFRQRRDLPMPDWLEQDAPDPFESFEDTHDLASLFADLPARRREVLELRYIDGLEFGEIAERLGIDANAVYQAHHHGLKAVAEKLRG
jgi:RNA polymerase sigma factor (sigma-70 family)